MIQHPCPICHELVIVIGMTKNNKKIGSCGHTWKFKKSKSAKLMDRKYVKTEFGLELVKP